jgi:hypothetical protein
MFVLSYLAYVWYNAMDECNVCASNQSSLYLPPTIIRRTPKPLFPVFPFTSPVPTILILLELDEGNLEMPAPTGLGNADELAPPYLASGLRPLATGALTCAAGIVALTFAAATAGTRFGPTAGGAL